MFADRKCNSGRWLTSYTWYELRVRAESTRLVLPICSLGTPLERLESLGDLLLPPLYHEALSPGLKAAMLHRIEQCFPYYQGSRAREERLAAFEVVELPPSPPAPAATEAGIVAFSVDTAVEQHGPHLPLATDTFQSYAVLRQLAGELPELELGPAVDYGHLTWGLPFGMSVDLTTSLTRQYVAGFARAVQEWRRPRGLYVVDVHGSPAHREAIRQGLVDSGARFAFRWLHEPLVEFAGDRGDQHAGGVETALIEHIDPELLDRRWWPSRMDALQAGQLSLDRAVAWSADVPRFVAEVERSEKTATPWNGIVGAMENYGNLDAEALFRRMLDVARQDLETLR